MAAMAAMAAAGGRGGGGRGGGRGRGGLSKPATSSEAQVEDRELLQLLERERGLRCSALAFRTTAGFYGVTHPHAAVVSDWNKRIQTEEANRKAKEEAVEQKRAAEAARKKLEEAKEKAPKEKKAKKAKKEKGQPKTPPPK